MSNACGICEFVALERLERLEGSLHGSKSRNWQELTMFSIFLGLIYENNTVNTSICGVNWYYFPSLGCLGLPCGLLEWKNPFKTTYNSIQSLLLRASEN